MWWMHGLPLSAVRQTATDMLYGGALKLTFVCKKGTSDLQEIEGLPGAAGDEAKAARQRSLCNVGILTDAELKVMRNQLKLD